eukprot:g9647.t1
MVLRFRSPVEGDTGGADYYDANILDFLYNEVEEENEGWSLEQAELALSAAQNDYELLHDNYSDHLRGLQDEHEDERRADRHAWKEREDRLAQLLRTHLKELADEANEDDPICLADLLNIVDLVFDPQAVHYRLDSYADNTDPGATQ